MGSALGPPWRLAGQPAATTAVELSWPPYSGTRSRRWPSSSSPPCLPPRRPSRARSREPMRRLLELTYARCRYRSCWTDRLEWIWTIGQAGARAAVISFAPPPTICRHPEPVRAFADVWSAGRVGTAGGWSERGQARSRNAPVTRTRGTGPRQSALEERQALQVTPWPHRDAPCRRPWRCHPDLGGALATSFHGRLAGHLLSGHRAGLVRSGRRLRFPARLPGG